MGNDKIFMLNDLELLGIKSNERSLETVKESGYNIAYVENPNYEICIASVRQDGNTLEHIMIDEINLTKEEKRNIYMEAIKESGRAIDYIKEDDREKYKDLFKYKDLKDKDIMEHIVAIKINGEWKFSVSFKHNISKDEFIEWIYNDRIKILEEEVAFDRDSSLFNQLETMNRKKYLDFLDIIDLIK
ncbi:TPA: hypothetical protein KRM00_003920 [Clostridioides difficile]|uniref:Uncharacterized protein n=1 Tax=Clostridioides difficile TaxID=1496 RepID=A0AAN5VQI1_CLODI|nr:hypothetical protein [Clostridioides difficile]HBH1544371.1 hypothetical protein [Clostridioides difficile]